MNAPAGPWIGTDKDVYAAIERNDPDELTNLASDPQFAKTLTTMRKRTDALVDQYGGPILNSKYKRSTR